MRNIFRYVLGGTAAALMVLGPSASASATSPPTDLTGVYMVHHEAYCAIYMNYDEPGITTEGVPVVQFHKSRTQLELSVPAKDASGVIGYTTQGWKDSRGSSSGSGDFGGSHWTATNDYDANGSISLYYTFPSASNGVSSVNVGWTRDWVTGINYISQISVDLKENPDGHCFTGQ